MVEAPLFVRPYLKDMHRGELFIVMACGMAGIAGTVMVIYAIVLSPVLPDAMGHILSASIVSVPAAILIAAVMVPPQGEPTSGKLEPPQQATSAIDAITQGTLDGLALLLSIVAMLIVLIALVSLVNLALGLLPQWDGASLTLQRLLGWAMAPFVWLAGVPWNEATTAGSLMGTKTVLNEFIAYHDLAGLPAESLSPRSRLIMTYALCGFANFGSLGILIGGLATMVPERRSEIVSLGMRSIVAGTLATLMVGAVVGMLYAG
jgi:CNT family concentrative nucleoside transporter